MDVKPGSRAAPRAGYAIEETIAVQRDRQDAAPWSAARRLDEAQDRRRAGRRSARSCRVSRVRPQTEPPIPAHGFVACARDLGGASAQLTIRRRSSKAERAWVFKTWAG